MRAALGYIWIGIKRTKRDYWVAFVLLMTTGVISGLGGGNVLVGLSLACAIYIPMFLSYAHAEGKRYVQQATHRLVGQHSVRPRRPPMPPMPPVRKVRP